jgi:hypothetical protein
MFIFGLIGFGLYWWLTQYYYPVRDVAPIVNLLENGDFIGVKKQIYGLLSLTNGATDRSSDGRAKIDPNRIRIRGRGSDKIKHAILKVLNTSEDINVLRGAFGCAMAGASQRNVLFDKQSEREILEKAVARYNAQIPASSSENPWSVTADPDGYYYVQMGGFICP